MGQPSTVIVGGGIAGLATAWGLARAGAGPVTVLEREASLGFWSSGRNAGILRSAIPATATRQLALRSEARYHDLPLELVRHAPGPIFDAVGMVLCEGAPGLPAPLWWEDFEALGAVEAWSPAQLQTRVPYYQPEGTRAWWMPRAGRIQVSNLMTALERACLELGVQFRLGTRVQGLMHDDVGHITGVRLEDRSEQAADRVVLAPGAFVARFAEDLGVAFPARTTRRHLFYALPNGPWSPKDPVVWDDAAGFYFLGTENGELLLSLCDGDDADPEHLLADPLLARLAERRVQESLAALGPFDWKRRLVGIRTVSEDDVPVLGAHPGHPNLYWVAALGGHGITLSLALAELACDLIEGRSLPHRLQAALAFDSPERDFQTQRDYRPL